MWSKDFKHSHKIPSHCPHRLLIKRVSSVCCKAPSFLSLRLGLSPEYCGGWQLWPRERCRVQARPGAGSHLMKVVTRVAQEESGVRPSRRDWDHLSSSVWHWHVQLIMWLCKNNPIKLIARVFFLEYFMYVFSWYHGEICRYRSFVMS